MTEAIQTIPAPIEANEPIAASENHRKKSGKVRFFAGINFFEHQ
jgi:hypothetical protein